MELPARTLRKVHGIIQICALIPVLGALAVAVGWLFRHWAFATLGPDYIPMAPSTAWLFVLLGLALLLFARHPDSTAARRFAWVGALVTIIAGLARWVAGIRTVGAALERWLAPAAGQVGEIPVGRMSPLTAAAFLLAGAALVLALAAVRRGRLLRLVAGVLATLVVTVGMVVGVSYLSGAPLLYGSGNVPMALPTALGFLFLGVGLVLLADPQNAFLQSFGAGAGPGAAASRGRYERALLAVFAVVLAGVSGGGVWYVRRELAKAREPVEQQLAVIADYKARDIASWRQERFNDASFFHKAGFVARDVAAYLDDPQSAAATAELVHWLTLLKGGDRYESVQLLDAGLNRWLSVPPDAAPPGPAMRELLAAARRDTGVLITDLHRDETGTGTHLDIAFTVGPPAGPVPSSNPAPIALILLRVDPSRFLYPLIQAWPAASESAETLLVRREGDEVLFLNELRHRPGSALQLRLPASAPTAPSAMAARGVTGVVDGVDYRGVRVLAAVKPVAGSPWLMVAKVDQEEIFGPVRWQMWTASIGVVGGVLAVILGISVLWHRRHAEYYRHQLDLSRQHEREVERLNRLYAALSHINQAIVRTSTREGFFDDVCRALVAHAGFRLAWVGRWDRPTNAVVPVGQTGDEAGYLAEIKVFADDRPEGQGPVGAALRAGRPEVCNDYANDPRTRPWRAAAARHGIRAIAVFPVRRGGTVWGALCVYAAEPGFFGPKETGLLEEAAADLSFGLDLLDRDEQRRAAEAARRESEDRLRLALSAAQMGTWDWDLLTNAIVWSRGHEDLWGYAPGSYRGTYAEFEDRIHPEDRAGLAAVVQHALADRTTYRHEFRVVWPDGTVHWIAGRGRAFYDGSGRPVRMIGVVHEITDHREAAARQAALLAERVRTEQALRASREQLRALAARLQQVREEERAGIAREIHDQLGQALTGLKMDLAWVSRHLERGEGESVQAKLAEITQRLEETVGIVRRISSELRPGILDDLGLGAAVEWQAADFQARAGIACRVENQLADLPLNTAVSTAVFRIFQELLTNVARHAGARTVAVRLGIEAGVLTLVVHDNGRGIAPAELNNPHSLGLLGMRERAAAVGGTVAITGGPGQGTTVTVRVPVDQPES